MINTAMFSEPVSLPEGESGFVILNHLGRKLYDEESVVREVKEYILITYLRHSPSTLVIAEILNGLKASNIYQKYLSSQ